MSSPTARLFIGSSAEGQDVAANLQDELEGRGVCEVDLWKHVFEPSRYALESLLKVAAQVDFAVLVASPDDVTESRGIEAASVRDNIVLEFGLFAGALGRERTYLLATGEAKLPTDILGLTRLPFRPRSDGNLRAAVNGAVLEIAGQVERLGRLARTSAAPGSTSMRLTALDQELDLLCANAEAQGWVVKTNSSTTLRLRSPRGQTFTLAKGQPDPTRAELRGFAAQLRAAGLRVNSSVWRPVEESPSRRTRRVPLQGHLDGIAAQGDGAQTRALPRALGNAAPRPRPWVVFRPYGLRAPTVTWTASQQPVSR